jgi:diguanylate cyclase (GGDEF)-like protein
MNQNIVNLVIVLVAANVVLIAVAIVRSLRQRRRQGAAGPQRVASQLRSVAAPGDAGLPALPSNDDPLLNRTDPLTGLLLPWEWNRIVADEDARNHRYGRPATVVIVELDGLDRLVAALGPQAGDRVLPALADALGRNARGADHLARLGPARFGILLPETGEVEAVNYVERVRQACDLWLESGAIALRLAIGWASPAPDANLSDAVVLAQNRMYAELHRNARRDGELEIDGTGALADAKGSPSATGSPSAA